MKPANEIKKKINKSWDSYKFHKAWMKNELVFPYHINILKPNDKILLHHFVQVRNWISELNNTFNKNSGVCLLYKEINYGTMGKQSMPATIKFRDIESLAKFLGKWQYWQQFCSTYQMVKTEFFCLHDWLIENPATIYKYMNSWLQLLAVCRYFSLNHKPGCYLREFDIKDVDTKFVEKHKAILKKLLDIILPDSAINRQYTKLTEHGFEKRYGCSYEPSRIRFRILDKCIATDFLSINDLEIPIEQFSHLNMPDLLCDRVYITENKINGLVFPELKNSLVIFGLGYGISILKTVNWLKQCTVYYWGDIDTHGFAILSQLRSYFPHIKSWLMDEETLLFCKSQWGQEPASKTHQADFLPHLNSSEQKMYQQLKNNYWQQNLRLEQEKIPFSYWRNKL
jgi:hypothetical protein